MNSPEENVLAKTAVRTRSPFVYALAGLACVGIMASLLSNSGFCISNGKFLNDEDYFRGAADSVIHDPLDGVIEERPGAIVFKQVHSQRYSSADEFLNENPGCCKFVAANSGDGGPEINIFDRIRGVKTVEISYDKRYVEDGVQKSSRFRGKVAVTSCSHGRPLR